jgi:hypothetical protein
LDILQCGWSQRCQRLLLPGCWQLPIALWACHSLPYFACAASRTLSTFEVGFAGIEVHVSSSRIPGEICSYVLSRHLVHVDLPIIAADNVDGKWLTKLTCFAGDVHQLKMI